MVIQSQEDAIIYMAMLEAMSKWLFNKDEPFMPIDFSGFFHENLTNMTDNYSCLQAYIDDVKRWDDEDYIRNKWIDLFEADRDDIEELKKGILDRERNWFEKYKAPDYKPPKITKLEDSNIINLFVGTKDEIAEVEIQLTLDNHLISAEYFGEPIPRYPSSDEDSSGVKVIRKIAE